MSLQCQIGQVEAQKLDPQKERFKKPSADMIFVCRKENLN